MQATRGSAEDAGTRARAGGGISGRGLAAASLTVALAVAFMVAPALRTGSGAMPQDPAAGWNDLASTGPTQEAPRATAAHREQQVLAEFIAKRFRVAQDAVGGFVAAAFRAGTEYRVDPLLVLAVVAVESRFNPVAESAQGAMGLMQVLPKYHQDKLIEHGGDIALLDPALNIDIGTRILQEYLRRGGDVETGLQLYLGTSDESSAQYTGRVLSERARMEQLLARQRRPGA